MKWKLHISTDSNHSVKLSSKSCHCTNFIFFLSYANHHLFHHDIFILQNSFPHLLFDDSACTEHVYNQYLCIDNGSGGGLARQIFLASVSSLFCFSRIYCFGSTSLVSLFIFVLSYQLASHVKSILNCTNLYERCYSNKGCLFVCLFA